MKKRILSLLLISIMIITAGCGSSDKKSEAKNIALSEIHTAVKEAYGEDYLPSMAIDDAALKNTLGVDPELCEEYIAEIPMISANVDTFAAIKAKSGKAKEVQTALEAYREVLVNDTMQYPANQIKIQASEVVSYGDYVFFIMLGAVPADVEESADEDAALKAYQEQNKKAKDAIEGLLL